MTNIKEQKFTTTVGGKPIEITVSNLAEQANASVFVRSGDTVVMVNVVLGQRDRFEIDYFPLEVVYEEKYYAAGKIYGSRFIRREGRPTEIAILTGRMIDRTLRPLFDKKLRREVQIIVTVLSIDQDNDPDVLGMLGASTALCISDIPFAGPVAGVRISKKGDALAINPTFQERMESQFSAIISGIAEAVNMIEVGGKETKEEDLASAFVLAQQEIKKLVEFQKEIVAKVGTPKKPAPMIEFKKEIKEKVQNFCKDKLEDVLFGKEHTAQTWPISEFKKQMIAEFTTDGIAAEDLRSAALIFEDEIDELLHQKVLNDGKRPDGRKLDEVRPLGMRVGLLPRTHGTGLFMRGLTKALSVTTLASPGEELTIQGIEFAGTKRFLHHYNFPAYSTGETGGYRGPGRREIGHGALAEKALEPIIPTAEQFPYTIRVVSEILSSNGSTSMASACASSLSLMDAGVPISRPVAGISVGLILGEKGSYKLLTDIQGPEDHHGDMDFKVAGTAEGVTAIQMDVKIGGINKEIFVAALEAGRKARLSILGEMKKVIDGPRSSLSPYAPKIISMKISPEKIGAVIGPGGRIINEIIQKTGAKIDIEDDGMVFITSDDEKAAKAAAEWIANIAREFKVGELFKAKVVRIVDFGAFVELVPGQDALLHISEIAPQRINRVTDVIKVGDIVDVKIKNIDESGKISVSRKAALK